MCCVGIVLSLFAFTIFAQNGISVQSCNEFLVTKNSAYGDGCTVNPILMNNTNHFVHIYPSSYSIFVTMLHEKYNESSIEYVRDDEMHYTNHWYIYPKSAINIYGDIGYIYSSNDDPYFLIFQMIYSSSSQNKYNFINVSSKQFFSTSGNQYQRLYTQFDYNKYSDRFITVWYSTNVPSPLNAKQLYGQVMQYHYNTNSVSFFSSFLISDWSNYGVGKPFVAASKINNKYIVIYYESTINDDRMSWSNCIKSKLYSVTTNNYINTQNYIYNNAQESLSLYITDIISLNNGGYILVWMGVNNLCLSSIDENGYLYDIHNNIDLYNCNASISNQIITDLGYTSIKEMENKYDNDGTYLFLSWTNNKDPIQTAGQLFYVDFNQNYYIHSVSNIIIIKDYPTYVDFEDICMSLYNDNIIIVDWIEQSGNLWTKTIEFNLPTISPTQIPSEQPTIEPTTEIPSISPTTSKPSLYPTMIPTNNPSRNPIIKPSQSPSINQSYIYLTTETNMITTKSNHNTNEIIVNNEIIVIIGMCIAVIVLIVVGVVCYYFIRKRKQNENKSNFELLQNTTELANNVVN